MNILAITPEQFTTDSAAWLGAIVGFLLAVIAAVTLILPRLAALKTQIDGLVHSRDVQRQDIQANQKAITQIALSTPPNTTSSPANPPQ